MTVKTEVPINDQKSLLQSRDLCSFAFWPGHFLDSVSFTRRAAASAHEDLQRQLLDWPGPALASRTRWTAKYRFYVMLLAGSRTFCVYNYITFQRVLPLPLTLGASRTSRGLPVLADGGRHAQHRYIKVPRVLPERRGPYAVVISRGLFRCRRSPLHLLRHAAATHQHG